MGPDIGASYGQENGKCNGHRDFEGLRASQDESYHFERFGAGTVGNLCRLQRDCCQTLSYRSKKT